MNNKIILENSDDKNSSSQKMDATMVAPRLNLFLGRSDKEPDMSKFPEWDVLPPSQFINPRTKK
jgi:hypothetical protein